MKLLAVLFFCAASSLQAQTFELSVPSIMRGPELVGEPPQSVRFTDDNKWVFFRWKPGGQPWHQERSLYRVQATGGAPEKLSDAAADSIGVLIANGPISPDTRWRAVSYLGDLYLINRATLATRRLTNTRALESSPVFSADGGRLFFLRDDNVYALTLVDGALAQLTDVRTGPAPEEPKVEGQRSFLERQQRELFEHIRLESARRDSLEKRRKDREARETRIVYLGRDERAAEIAVDRSGSWAVLRTRRTSTGSRVVQIPDWVTRSGYTENLESRTKVGDAQGQLGRIGVLDLRTGEVRWVEVAPKRDTAAVQLASVTFLGWSGDGQAALIGSLSADFKDQWLFVLDAKTGGLRQIAHERNNAWIQSPCTFWLSCAGWLPDNRTVYYASEKDGFSHVYLVDRDGTNERQITKGNWEVYRLELAPTKDRFYVRSNEGTPAEQHVYHMSFDGKRTRITAAPGHQDFTASHDGQRIAVVHSSANTPPELYVGENRANAELARVTTSPTAAWSSHEWTVPPIVNVRARDGVDVPARIYRPSAVGAAANGAAVIFVHGAGYLQNVHNWWSDYYREYMFHHLLATRGFTVLDVDYRGSQGYGRDWRTAIYRHMGGKDLTDQIDATRYLIANEGVDSTRIGIYGGSYGGFITLMALFTAGEHFAAGAALRSVTDWAHYNHGYTGRILNTPQSDSIAFRQSSPIYFAEGLNDPLLILHGMVDTNVHFSDVVRLTQRLIELGKTDWELAVYPVEDHSFVEPSSWTDEYRRILALFERTLR
jgi:dipeptidyl aminopeptidase/acylaminoacyl peptidase